MGLFDRQATSPEMKKVMADIAQAEQDIQQRLFQLGQKCYEKIKDKPDADPEDNLKDCYPPEAKGMLKEIYSGGESYVEIMAEMEEADEEEFELFQKMMSCFKVSDSRMLDQEECEECEELIRKNHDITIEIDGGCLVEVEIVPDSKMEKMLKELGIDLEDLDDTKSVMLVLRTGKYIGPWASAGGLELDEITSLRRDLEWK